MSAIWSPIETSHHVREKLLEEIGIGVQGVSPEKSGKWCVVPGSVWNYEITSINDKPITVPRS